MSEKHFLHFGCWNKGQNFYISGETQRETQDNPDIASNLTNVMRKLNEVTNEIKPQFIVVAGDNYYPNKINFVDGNGAKTKIKLFDEEDMKSGFEGLPKNVEIDIIMGNHDYETNLLVTKENMTETSCKILKLEYDLEKQPNNNLNILVNKARKFNDSTLILMIDTTIYSDDDAQTVVNCYNMHPNIKTGMVRQDLTIDSIRESQANFMRTSISDNIDDSLKNIIIVGHHPITVFKLLKKQEVKLVDKPGAPLVDAIYKNVFEVLNQMGKHMNYYYLCADLHQYQIGNIFICPQGSSEKMLIKQYTVGTGGADLDPFPFSKSDISNEKRDRLVFENNGVTYNLDYLMIPEELELSGSMYGFLQCTINGDNLLFKFIDVNDKRYEERHPTEGLNILLEQRGGRRINKSQKRKNKNHNKYKSVKCKKIFKSQKINKNKRKNKKTRKIRNKF
jgi:predicted phosphodiesterase